MHHRAQQGSVPATCAPHTSPLSVPSVPGLGPGSGSSLWGQGEFLVGLATGKRWGPSTYTHELASVIFIIHEGVVTLTSTHLEPGT